MTNPPHTEPRPDFLGLPRPDPQVVDLILRSVLKVFDQGQAIEMRALNVTLDKYNQGKTASGYYDNVELLANDAAKLDQCHGTIYTTLNPPDRGLLARSYNRLTISPKHTTADFQVPRRTRLLVDCDPTRFAGIPSTDEEHQAALAKASDIAAYLSEVYAWPQPVLGSSGNGAHLIYRIDLPGDDGGLVQRVLKVLAYCFEDSAIAIDQTCFNPARITKLFGTTARKGDHVPHLGMPWRGARIITSPDRLKTVTQEQLNRVASLLPEGDHVR